MKSMTGYGRASAVIGGRSVGVQVSSVNRRTLDLTVGLPAEWESLETAVAERTRRQATRGKIHVSVELEAASPEEGADWDAEAVEAALGKLAALAKSHGVPFHPTPDLLWQIATSRRKTAGLPSSDAVEADLLRALDEALRAFAAMRAKEGEALLIDFLSRLALLRRHLEGIASRAPQVAPNYREALTKRLRDAKLEFDLNDERVLREVAIFADRCDISEEITRFRSHLDQFAELLKEESDIGRKAEFILQELNREAHTMGSKANDLEISRHVIELRNELERVKEQIANIE